MVKRIMITGLLVVVSLYGKTQNEVAVNYYKTGINAGPGIFTIKYMDKNEKDTVSFYPRIGLSAGFNFNIFNRNSSSLTIGGLFGYSSYTLDDIVHQDYHLCAPVSYNYNKNKSLLYAGISFNIFATEVLTDAVGEKCRQSYLNGTSSYDPFNIGIHGGIGFSIMEDATSSLYLAPFNFRLYDMEDLISGRSRQLKQSYEFKVFYYFL